MNAVVLLQLLISLGEQLNKAALTLRAANSEGRDVTAEEIKAVLAGDDVAKAALQAHIDAILKVDAP